MNIVEFTFMGVGSILILLLFLYVATKLIVFAIKEASKNWDDKEEENE